LELQDVIALNTGENKQDYELGVSYKEVAVYFGEVV